MPIRPTKNAHPTYKKRPSDLRKIWPSDLRKMPIRPTKNAHSDLLKVPIRPTKSAHIRPTKNADQTY